MVPHPALQRMMHTVNTVKIENYILILALFGIGPKNHINLVKKMDS